MIRQYNARKRDAISRMTVAVAIIAVLVVAGAASYYYYSIAYKAPSKLENLRIGLFPSVDWLGFYVADSEGYFKQQGLNFTIVNMAGGAVIAPAIQSGSIDMGITAVVPVTVARDKGFNFKIFTPAEMFAYPSDGFKVGAYVQGVSTNAVIVKKDSTINSWRDLEGKSVATNTLGTITDYTVREVVERSGGDSRKITFVAVPFPNMIDAVLQGRVDAANANEPWLTVARQSGNFKIIGDAYALTPRWLTGGYFSTESWINGHQSEVKGFVNALQKAVDFIHSNPDKARAILAKYTGYSSQVANDVTLYTYVVKVTQNEVQFGVDLAYKWAGLKTQLSASDVVDIRFVQLSSS